MSTPKKRTNQAREFGRRLREVREKKGDSLRGVEARSGLNSGYLSQLENGKIIHPSPSVLEKVATGYELRFEDVLRWVGYIPASDEDVPPNRAVALSRVWGLGDPSDEELRALNAIVDLIQSRRSASFAAPSDMALDDVAIQQIRGYALSLLREADAIGRRPTPLEDIQCAARLVMAGQLTLDARDRARLTERLGKWVGLAWKRLQGVFDFRTAEIWVKPDLHPMKRRFVLSHEIGHAILPAHEKTFAYVDDYTRLPPFTRDLFEREANQAAVEILFQAGQLTEEFDSSAPSLRRICDLSVAFGGSIVGASRYAAETSQRPVAVAVAHRNERGLGPLHVYTSRSFEARFGWRQGGTPWLEIRRAVSTAKHEEPESWLIKDRRADTALVNVQKMDTGWAAIALLFLSKGWRLANRPPSDVVQRVIAQ